MSSPKKMVPPHYELMKPLLKALIQLGGSGTIEEINGKTLEIAELSDEILAVPHANSDTLTEVEYRLAWARTYLKKSGYLDNSERGVWALLKPEIDPDKLDPHYIVKQVQEKARQESKEHKPKKATNAELFYIDETQEEWKEKLLETIIAMSPAAFERLAQRLLRESGFIHVEVLGKTGDGGIDGKGIMRMGGLLSFHVIFQCKKYKGSITPDKIRDFRGAMQGRADKGLFITTGSFTREANKEATRDGAPPIDLIDGELLCEKLKELKLGVKTTNVERVEVDKIWFETL